MLDKMVVNILNEASLQLKSYTKDKLNDKFGLSFEDLLSSNQKNVNIETNRQTAEKPQNPNNENINRPTNENEKVIDKNSIKNDSKNATNAKEISKSKGKIEEKVSDKENSILMTVDKAEIQKPADKNKKELLKIEIDDPNFIKSKFMSLDNNLRQKIESILEQFNAGKIDKLTANSFIAQIIKANQNNNSNIHFDKRKGVENTKSDIAGTDHNIKVNNNNKENIEVKPVVNNDSLINNKITDKKEINKKINHEESKNDLNKLSADKPVNEIKEHRVEINLNINENKIAGNNKSQIQNHQRLLEQNKDTLLNEITKNTKIILAPGETRFSTMIRPDNFGRIDLKFVTKDGKISGKMIMQSEETLNFFKNNVDELKAVMQKSNVELSNLEFILAGSNFSGENAANDNLLNKGNTEKFELSGISNSKDTKVYEESNDKAQVNYRPYFSDKNINIVI